MDEENAVESLLFRKRSDIATPKERIDDARSYAAKDYVLKEVLSKYGAGNVLLAEEGHHTGLKCALNAQSDVIWRVDGKSYVTRLITIRLPMSAC
jgi:hypothetical protein